MALRTPQTPGTPAEKGNRQGSTIVWTRNNTIHADRHLLCYFGHGRSPPCEPSRTSSGFRRDLVVSLGRVGLEVKHSGKNCSKAPCSLYLVQGSYIQFNIIILESVLKD